MAKIKEPKNVMLYIENKPGEYTPVGKLNGVTSIEEVVDPAYKEYVDGLIERDKAKTYWDLRVGMGEYYEDLCCGHCGEFICLEPGVKDLIKQKKNFCPYCGGRLDFEKRVKPLIARKNGKTNIENMKKKS